MKQLILSDPKVMDGKPCIAGTRITIKLILEGLGAGESIEQMLEEYPFLTREGIQAALSYAASALTDEMIYPTPEAVGENTR